MPAQTPLHRIHLTQFGGVDFNPCQGGQTRFAPITDIHGACVPSLYAATSFDAACYETLFHDVGAGGRFKTVPLRLLTQRSHSVVKTNRPLQLASLFAPDLKRWELTRDDITTSPPLSYAQTAQWAQALHHQFGGLDGLVWTSNQCDPDLAILLFGDRIEQADLSLVSTRNGATDTELQAEARRAGHRGGITLIR